MNADEQLAALLRDAVADVEPTDRLSELRARTATSSAARRWWPAVGGAVLATAAAITAIAVLGNDSPTAVDPGPAAPVDTRAQAVYYIGDTLDGPRLYREFQQVEGESLTAALDLLTSVPRDPDYRSAWAPGQLQQATRDLDTIVVGVDPSVVERPPGMSEDEAQAAVQQVVYTMQAAERDLFAVRFRTDGAEYLATVLGVPVDEQPLRAPVLDTLSRVNLSDPSEGQVVQDTLAVRGVANSNEANVHWILEREGEFVTEGAFTALGYMEPRLFPFSGEIDVSSLDPGTYTLIVETDDPSGGTEGGTPVFTDTRTFVIE